MGKHCRLCRVEAVKGDERSFHRFPDPQYQKEAWCQALNIDIKILKNWTFVCSDHFTPECFIYRSNGQRFLKDDAVPFPYKGQLKRIGRRKKGYKKDLSVKDNVAIKTECEEQEILNTNLDGEIKIEKSDYWEETENFNQTDEKYCLDNVILKTDVATENECEVYEVKTEEILIKSDLDHQMEFQRKENSANPEFIYYLNQNSEGERNILPKLFKLMYPEVSVDGFYFCKECSFHTAFSQNLRKHFIVHRETEFRNNPENFKDYKSYHCTLCNYVTIQKYNLSRHMIKHLPNDGKAIKMYTCTECEYSTKYRCDIIKHQVKHVPKGLRFNCTKCSFKAYDESHLKDHLEKGHVEHKRYKYECEYCPYKTDSKAALGRHSRDSHSENRPFKYECKFCSFKSDSKASYNQHTKQGHREERVPLVSN